MLVRTNEHALTLAYTLPALPRPALPCPAMNTGVRRGLACLYVRSHGLGSWCAHRGLRGIRDVEDFERKPPDPTGAAEAGGHLAGD